MKKIALLLAVLLLLSACGSPKAETAGKSSSQASSEAVSSAPLPTASELAAAEQAAAEQAAAEQAAAEQAAAEQAAAEQAAAAQAAAEKAAAEQAAAAQAAAEKAAAEQAAAEQAAAQAAAKKAAAAQTPKVNVSGSNFLSKVEKRIITLTNEERAAQGLSQLTYDENLQAAARIRSKELYRVQLETGHKIEHERPNGDKWSTVLKEDVPVTFKAAGENLCSAIYSVGYEGDPGRDPEFWMEQWLGSEAHYSNIVKPGYTHLGVGVYCIEKDDKVYAFATTLFAEF